METVSRRRVIRYRHVSKNAFPLDFVSKPPLQSPLNSREFNAIKDSGDPLFILFGAPWCGHSRTTMPMWIELQTIHPGIVTTVDCTSMRDDCHLCGVNGYPTFMLFHDGKKVEYNGVRTVHAWDAWLRNQLPKVFSVNE